MFFFYTLLIAAVVLALALQWIFPETAAHVGHGSSLSYFFSVFPQWLAPCIAGLVVLAVLILSDFFHDVRKNKSALRILARVQSASNALVPHIRLVIYVLCIAGVLAVFWQSTLLYPTVSSSLSYLTRMYGLVSLGLLFLSLLPGLMLTYFDGFPINPLLVQSRRAFGVGTFLFAFLHSGIGFFFNLSGSLQSIFFLSVTELLSILFGAAGLLIFAALALTSLDRALAWMGHGRWKMLHRLVYLAAILVVVHTFWIGSHYTNPKDALPVGTNVAALSLVFLELGATAKKWRPSQRPWIRRTAVALVALLALAGSVALGGSAGINPHAAHEWALPSYLVNVSTVPAVLSANQRAIFSIQIVNASSGEPETHFDAQQPGVMNLILVSRDLHQFQHVFPRYLTNGTFSIQIFLPKEGQYVGYLDYYVNGTNEQSDVFALNTTNATTLDSVPSFPQGPLIQTMGGLYRFSVNASNLSANTLDLIHFHLAYLNRTAITDLEPYAGAFGYLTLLSPDGSTFPFVYPTRLSSSASERAGPDLAYFTTFPAPGQYAGFFEFKENDSVHVASFAVNVPA